MSYVPGSTEYLHCVALENARFHAGEELHNPVVRPEILASWQRSRRSLGTGHKKGRCLQPEELEKVFYANKELINCAIPVINYLKNILQSSSSGILLADCNGVLLHVNGDEELIARHPSLVNGAVVTEQEEGTNSIGLCLALEKQVEVFGSEHYFLQEQNWCCVSAPLRGGRQRLMGVLTVILPLSEYHIHTTGMLMMAAKDINDQHHLNDLLSDQEAILELVGIGILVLDKHGGIKAANTKGRDVLHLPPKPTPLGNVAEALQSPEPFLSMLNSKKRVVDEDRSLHLSDGDYLHCSLSASPIPNDKGIVISLYEANRMQQLAAHSVGARAIYTFDSIIGESDLIRNAVELSRAAANSDITTLILGESGTGKELFAHAIHNGSARRDKPFVIVNCGALPRDLIQSELFGYDAGAFTGAQKEGKAGKFELANGGTIFLDEIGDMPLEAQINLLRLIQNGEVTRIGGRFSRHVDVRIIAATNKNLRNAVANGSFREDLFYRLSVLTVDVPPLRERPQDILPLAEFFFQSGIRTVHKKLNGFTPGAMRAMREYTWPGNVRELENVVERALNLAKGPHIDVVDLPTGNAPKPQPVREKHFSPSARLPQPVSVVRTTEPKTLQSSEAEALMESLHACRGNMRAAALSLGISRSALYAKLNRLGIDIKAFRDC